MVNQVWFRLDEALPPLDSDGESSITVALVLKSGALVKGFRYYNPAFKCWAILDEKDTELKDDEIARWSKIPSF